MGYNILLALGALAMFGTFLGSSNRVIMGNNQIASQNEYYIAALSYAQSVIDEAKTKSFKGKTGVVTGTKDGASVSLSNTIGIESLDEKFPYPDTLSPRGYQSEFKFDDVDDYHGYRRLVNSPRAEGYMLHVAVAYVERDKPNKTESSPTTAKRMIVSVTSPYFPKIEKDGLAYPDTLKLTYVFSK